MCARDHINPQQLSLMDEVDPVTRDDWERPNTRIPAQLQELGLRKIKEIKEQQGWK